MVTVNETSFEYTTGSKSTDMLPAPRTSNKSDPLRPQTLVRKEAPPEPEKKVGPNQVLDPKDVESLEKIKTAKNYVVNATHTASEAGRNLLEYTGSTVGKFMQTGLPNTSTVSTARVATVVAGIASLAIIAPKSAMDAVNKHSGWDAAKAIFAAGLGVKYAHTLSNRGFRDMNGLLAATAFLGTVTAATSIMDSEAEDMKAGPRNLFESGYTRLKDSVRTGLRLFTSPFRVLMGTTNIDIERKVRETSYRQEPKPDVDADIDNGGDLADATTKAYQ